MIKKRKKVTFFILAYFMISCHQGATAAVENVDSNPCCQVISVESSGPLAQFYPEHLGSYKLLKDKNHVFKHLTNPHSFIYSTRRNFEGSEWVIGVDATRNSHISSWPQKTVWSRQKNVPKKSIFDWTPHPKTHKYKIKSNCPLDTDVPVGFNVWDGYHFVQDDTIVLKCTLDKLDRMEIEGCCQSIRVASSHIQSLALQHHSDKLGLYSAIGEMNGLLVYQQRIGSSVAFTWQDKQGILRW